MAETGEIQKWQINLVGFGVSYAGYFVRREGWHGTRTSEVLNQAVERKFLPYLPAGYLPIHNVARAFDTKDSDQVREIILSVDDLVFAYDTVKDLGSDQKRVRDQHVRRVESPLLRVVSRGIAPCYYIFEGQLIWGQNQMTQNVFWPMKVIRSYKFQEKNPPVEQNVERLRNLYEQGIFFVINSRHIETVQPITAQPVSIDPSEVGG